MPGTIIGPGDMAINKTVKASVDKELTVCRESDRCKQVRQQLSTERKRRREEV